MGGRLSLWRSHCTQPHILLSINNIVTFMKSYAFLPPCELAEPRKDDLSLFCRIVFPFNRTHCVADDERLCQLTDYVELPKSRPANRREHLQTRLAVVAILPIHQFLDRNQTSRSRRAGARGVGRAHRTGLPYCGPALVVGCVHPRGRLSPWIRVTANCCSGTRSCARSAVGGTDSSKHFWWMNPSKKPLPTASPRGCCPRRRPIPSATSYCTSRRNCRRSVRSWVIEFSE